ncbi:MAG: ATP-binding protein [Bacteroidota bacterium]
MHHRKFKRDLGSLLEVFRFIDQFVTEHDITPSVTLHVRLAVDELFTNMVKFQPATSDVMSISLDQKGDRIIVRMTYQGVEPFDITQVPEPGFDVPLERRDERGLGIYLCRKVMDDVSYEYENQGKTVTITLVKTLER